MGNSGELLIFAKPPRHGRVKTRLQPAITPSRAAVLHQSLLLLTLLRHRGTDQMTLCSPANDPSRLLNRLTRRLSLRHQWQQGRDLGERMRRALDEAVIRNRQPAALIGSDCPFITPDYLQLAWQALRHKPYVLGPANDGGFVLIGARRPLPRRCFDGVEWGTARVLEQTLKQMKRAGADCALLPALDDIDRPDDLALLDMDRLHRMRWLFGCQ